MAEDNACSSENRTIIMFAILCIGGLACFGTGIYFAVEQGTFNDTLAAQCKYDRYEYIDCSSESDSIHSGNVDCEYWKVYYHYDTYDINNEYNHPDNASLCDGEVIISTKCYCVSDDTVSKDGIRTIKEPPSPADNQWHDCYINSCDINGFTWMSASEHTEAYTICFVIGSICFVLLIIACIYTCKKTDFFKPS